MRSEELKLTRLDRGWTQMQAAERLNVSQSYLAMLETGKRSLTPELARSFRRVYNLDPTVLLTPSVFVPPPKVDNQKFAEELGALGYPGFSYLSSHVRKKNPAQVLLEALTQDSLEARLVEALPWLLLKYWKMDANWLVQQAKLCDLQNRLGFLVSLAQRVSEVANPSDDNRNRALEDLRTTLDRSRLAKEDTFGKPPRTPTEREWVLTNRTDEARHWNLLTDWRPEHFQYAV
jgi:transcriptional regulator with XRE-family HTH domain